MSRGPDLGFDPARFAAVSLAAVLFSLLAPAPSAASALPDGRVYEQVTPADKNGGDVGGPAIEALFASAYGQSSTDGKSIAYISLSSFGDAQSAELVTNYISSRGEGGWSTHSIAPPVAVPRRYLDLSPFQFFTDDLSAGLLEWAEPILVPGAPPGFAALYVREADGTYDLVTDATPASLPPSDYGVTFAGATPDLTHVVLEANDALTADAPSGGQSIYEWSEGSLRLVSVLPGPGGGAATGARVGSGADVNFADVVSDDGSRVFWTDAASQLYVREDGAETLKLNSSRRAVSLGDGTARLLAIATDGSRAIFTDPVALTDQPGDSGGGLYRYDLETGVFRDLTPYEGGDPGIQGVLGASEDGSLVYFVATAVLAGGASAGGKNLYVVGDDGIEFIATLIDADRDDWTDSFEARTARITSNGAHAAFISRARLTGYDNTDVLTGAADPELFVYAADRHRLTCVSCNPGGERPIGGAGIPVGTSPSYQPRILSDDGSRVFFNSGDALVAADGNGRQDVYEYVDGMPKLISGGTSGDMSALVDVTASGHDLFFTTRARLVATDRDNDSDIYDARVAGGFPVDAEPLPCAGEACRGPLSAPPPLGPGAATRWGGDAARSPGSKRARPRCRGRRRRSRRPRGSQRCTARRAEHRPGGRS
jgi:hypothetical protein